MLFSRREPQSLLETVRIALWPRRSWARSMRYAVLRFKRLDASPHALGLGLAIGVFAAFQPILGFQMMFAGALAWMLNASIPAALFGTFVGTPVTWPVMWMASYHLGALLIGESHAVTLGDLAAALFGVGATAAAAVTPDAGLVIWKIIVPLAVGAVPLGLLTGAAFYGLVIRSARLRVP